jgi:type III secretion protein Q
MTSLREALRQRTGDGQARPLLWPESRPLLPVIPVAAIEPVNAFYRSRPALAFPLAGRTVAITASWPCAPDDGSDRCQLDITVDGDYGALIVSRRIVKALVGDLDPSQDVDHLDPDHLALVLELALDEALSKLEANLGSGLAIESVRPPGAAASGAVSLAFKISVDSLHASSGELLLPPRHATRLAQFVNRHAADVLPPIELPVPARIRVAATTCSVAEIATLSPGDVVMADDCCRQPHTAIAVIAEHLAAPVKLTVAGAQITAAPLRAKNSSLEWSMENGGNRSQTEVLEETELDDIPVKLLFELGRVELSLAEVRQLAPGAVIPLQRPPEESVDISANGRRIGRGSLVQIGDNLGVRIARLFHHG